MTIRTILFTLAVLVVFLLFYESLANAAPTPAEFPRVAPVQQESRDAERRLILEDELKNEHERLADAAARKDAAAMARHTADIESIQRELGQQGRDQRLAVVVVKKQDAGLPDAFGGGLPDAFGGENKDCNAENHRPASSGCGFP